MLKVLAGNSEFKKTSPFAAQPPTALEAACPLAVGVLEHEPILCRSQYSEFDNASLHYCMHHCMPPSIFLGHFVRPVPQPADGQQQNGETGSCTTVCHSLMRVPPRLLQHQSLLLGAAFTLLSNSVSEASVNLA